MGYRPFSPAGLSGLRPGGADFMLRVLVPMLGTETDHSPTRNPMVDGLASRVRELGGTMGYRAFPSIDAIKKWMDQSKPYHGILLRQKVPRELIRQMSTTAVVVSADSRDAQSGVNCITMNENRAAIDVLRAVRERGHERVAWFGIIDQHAPPQRWVIDAADATGEDLSILTAHSLRHGAWSTLARCQPGDRQMPLLILERDWRSQTLEQVVRRGARKLMSVKNPPTVIVVSTLAMASALIDALKQLGHAVPEDVSIVAYGLSNEAAAFKKPITCVDIPLYVIGRVVPEMIQRSMAQPEAPVLTVLIEAGWFDGATLGRRVAKRAPRRRR
jgi:DNA-binding LacI/PurR family transcriptional regulator